MKNRNPFIVALLGFITLGLYGLYWLYDTRKVLIRETKQSIPSIWLLVIPSVIFMVLYFALFIPMFLSMPASEGSQTPAGFVWYFAGLALAGTALTVVHVYWFLKYSRAVSVYTHKEMGTAISFILLYLLNVIGMAVLQESFNAVGDTSAA